MEDLEKFSDALFEASERLELERNGRGFQIIFADVTCPLNLRESQRK
jgi:hypothetical protein